MKGNIFKVLGGEIIIMVSLFCLVFADDFPPEIVNYSPEKDAVNVQRDTAIKFTVQDIDDIDGTTMVVTVEGITVFDGSGPGPYPYYIMGCVEGSCSFFYGHPELFNPGQIVDVTIDCHDRVGNIMPQDRYSFTIISSIDTIPPTAIITSHSNNQIVSSSPITVTGTAFDVHDSAIIAVEVNGIVATTTNENSTWSVTGVGLVKGNNSVIVATEDEYFNRDNYAVSINVILDTNLDDFSFFKVYPNPYNVSFSSGITFDFLTEDSKIKIYTLNGQLIKEIKVKDEGRVTWDIKNEQGKKIASGIYIYVIVDEKGDKKSGKIAIVK